MKKMLAAVSLVFLLVFCVHTVMASTGVEVRSGLSGEVTWVIPAGTDVSEGTELVRIATLTGESAAARAPKDGRVEQVMVHPGDKLSPGMVVVRIVAQ